MVEIFSMIPKLLSTFIKTADKNLSREPRRKMEFFKYLSCFVAEARIRNGPVTISRLVFPKVCQYLLTTPWAPHAKCLGLNDVSITNRAISKALSVSALFNYIEKGFHFCVVCHVRQINLG